MSEQDPTKKSVSTLETEAIQAAVKARIEQEETFLEEFEAGLKEYEDLLWNTPASQEVASKALQKRKHLQGFLMNFLQGSHEGTLDTDEMKELGADILESFSQNLLTLKERGVLSDEEVLKEMAGSALRMEQLTILVHRFQSNYGQ